MRRLYRALQQLLWHLQQFLHIAKMFATEWFAIIRKARMYQDVNLDRAQRSELEAYWRSNYGRRISDRWHRQYMAINSIFRADYVPDVVFASVIEPAMNPFRYAALYGDKSLFEIMYSGLDGVKCPETLVVMASRICYGNGREVINPKGAWRRLREYDDFVMKPLIGGSSGVGVFFVEKGDRSLDEYEKYIRQLGEAYGSAGFIAQRRLSAHPSYSDIFPGSINTIRLITYSVSGEVHVAPICLRIGRGQARVDNIHSGGLVVGVDDEGFLMDVAYELGYSDKKITHRRHPDTQLEFAGYRVAGIPEMKAAATRLHGRTPRIGIVSWDLMLDEQENVVLVEGNFIGQSVWFPQIAHGKSIFGENTQEVLKFAAQH